MTMTEPDRQSGIDDRTLETLDWAAVLHALSGHARTTLGQAAASQPDFAATRPEAVARYAAVAEVSRLELQEGLSIPTGAISDITETLDLAGGGQVLENAQLIDVGHCMVALARLRRWIDGQREVAPTLRALVEPISVDAELMDILERSFDEAGQLSERMYPQLSEYRARIRALSSKIQTVLNDLLTGRLSGMVQDRFITERSGRYVLPLRTGYRRGVGIAHGTSQSGETVYVEPLEVVAHTNELKEAEAALERELRRILAELSRAVAHEIEPLLTSLDAAVDVDLAVARARLGAAWRGTVPEIGVQGTLLLRAARHAVLHLRGVDVIGNDLSISQVSPGLVLTGPNAGGKTIALKTLGLAALMVRAGLPLPVAEDSRADFFPHIFADIGDLQTVEGDLSTFSGHLTALKGVLADSGRGSLVLLDEVGMGTDPSQGAALAQAVLQTLVDTGAQVAITTHYSRLKDLPSADARFRIGAVRFVDGQPTYHFDLGLVGESHALAIARRLEFPAPVLERARLLLDAGERRVEELVARLEEEQATLRADQQRLKKAEAEAAELQKILDHRLDRLEQQRQRLEREHAADFQRRIQQTEVDVKALVAALQADPSLKKAGKTLQQIRRLRDRAAPRAPSTSEAPSPVPSDLSVGQRVQLRSLGSRGVVSRVFGNDRFEVTVGQMKMKVDLDDLVEGEPIRQHRDRAEERRKRQALAATVSELPQEVEQAFVSVRTDANTCDLRGHRADEALDKASLFLDGMVLRNESCVYILHGHGTGALKTAIRSWLPRAKQARRWRAALPHEGGDAFTLVELT
ncbi:MAG: DNA mismatch repair protein MutS2 [Myxococcota bacterium]|jgi:DNA mismatch repair protein MutS2